jgi:hypothetical protein
MSHEIHKPDKYHKEALGRELIRAEGFKSVASAVVHEQNKDEIPNVLAYYRENAAAFNQPSEDRGEVIFNREFDVALSFQQGVEVRETVNGKKTTNTKTLGDIIAENNGRILEIRTLLQGEPIPEAEHIK